MKQFLPFIEDVLEKIIQIVAIGSLFAAVKVTYSAKCVENMGFKNG